MKHQITTISTMFLIIIFIAFNLEATESPYGDSSCVEYDREGELYLVRNDCSEPGGGCTRTLLSFEDAVRYVKKYRWVDISASMKRPGHALWEAELKLLGTGAEALVMIYLPQGIDEIHCKDLVKTAWLIEAIKLYYYEDYPVDHLQFKKIFSQLIDEVTKDGLDILVTSKSYGAHQTLEVIYNNPRIFHVSIGPSFGAFKDTKGDVLNPHVNTYIENLRRAECKECIVTSFNDCWGLYAFGGALSLKEEKSFKCDDYKNPEHPETHPETNLCLSGSPPCRIYGNYEVYQAIYANSKNVKTVNVSGAGHYTPSYYDHGLIEAMRSCPALYEMELSVISDILNGKYPNYARSIPPIMGMILN